MAKSVGGLSVIAVASRGEGKSSLRGEHVTWACSSNDALCSLAEEVNESAKEGARGVACCGEQHGGLDEERFRLPRMDVCEAPVLRVLVQGSRHSNHEDVLP